MSDERDVLELELRSVPGVHGVGCTEESGALVIHLLTWNREAVPDIRRQVAQRVRAHLDGPALLEFGGPGWHSSDSPGGSGPGRVRLLEVRKITFTQEVEVHLARGQDRAIGRADAASPIAAVTATLDALRGLGIDLAFRADAATMAVGRDFEPAVVVTLHPEDGDSPRYGVGRAETLERAACHATLQALNRSLSQGVLLPTGSGA